MRVGLLSRLGIECIYRERLVPFIALQNRHHRHRGRLHSRQPIHRLLNKAVFLEAPLLRIAVQRRIDEKADQTLHPKPWVKIVQIPKTPDEQARPDQQQQ